MLVDITKETTLIVTGNYAKDSCPSNVLHEAISQSEKHTKWLSPCVTAVRLGICPAIGGSDGGITERHPSP